MSDAQAGSYRFEYTDIAERQLREIRLRAKEAKKFDKFVAIVKKAIDSMRTDPHGWGDPEYRSKHVDALYCHGTIRPVVFHYVIFEQIRGVVLLTATLYADFE